MLNWKVTNSGCEGWSAPRMAARSCAPSAAVPPGRSRGPGPDAGRTAVGARGGATAHRGLRFMTVLILRPEPQASTLAERLREAGHQAVGHAAAADLPRPPAGAAGFRPVPPRPADRRQQPCGGTGSAWLTAHGLAWPQMPTLAVGATTAASWQESGVQPQVPQDARSEGLLALPALNEVRGNGF